MSFPNANVSSPIKSPSLAEYDAAQLTDENSVQIPLHAAILVDANGHSNMGSAVIQAGEVSQVTGRRGAAQVITPGGEKIPLIGLMGLDSSGNPIPFAAGSAAKVSGKFQSTVQTGTGSAQNIPHGLGVVPSLVLVSMYDTNGVALPLAVSEGAHDATNVVVTATASLKYKVIAFA